LADDVYLLLLEFGREQEPAALGLLNETARRVFPGRRIRGVVVDNAVDASLEHEIGPDWSLVAGDNTLREFSGWDRGLEWIGRRHAPGLDSIVVLANDTIARSDKCVRLKNMPAERGRDAALGALVGYVEEYPRPINLFGLTLRQWVDTSFVASSWGTVKSLGSFAAPLCDAELFDTNWQVIFREPSPLSQNYRDYLKTWLFGEQIDAEFPHTWHKHEPLTETNFGSVKGKLRSLFCEHLLSARARLRQIPLVDIRQLPLAIDPF
jgi:hypothetical protein